MALLRAIILGVAVGFAAPAVPAAAQDVTPPPPPSVEAGIESDVGSLYLFRGLVYSSGAVTQSKVWLSSGRLDLYGWTNVAVPASPGARTLDEVDTGVAYTIERGAIAIVPALDIYMYRLSDAELAGGVASHTAELSLAESYTRGGTTLSAKQVVDARSYRGAFFGQVGVSHTRPLSASADVEVAALAGWASRRFSRSYFGPDVSGLALAGASVSVTRRVGRRLYLRPHVEITAIPASRLRAAVTRPFNAIVGVAVGAVR
ncbi:MAG: hypothetical protein R2708_07860 [Vicinamibacterales bacterium]